MNTLAILDKSLSSLIDLPDSECAHALNDRIIAWNVIDELHERSYVERGLIAIQFEKKQLWKHLIDPDTDTPFASFTAWMSCSQFLGCRRTNFEAKRTVALLTDVPAEKLVDIPKGNLHTLTQLSTAVRNDPGILAAAKNLSQDEFLSKVEKEQPHQHIEARRPLRFSPDRSGAKLAEETIQWALNHDIAGSRDEAFVRAMETALHEWQLEQELRDMPVDEVRA